ncbi:MAG: hypothetical protein V3T17_05340 [Pseudomonadales bacterium]
MEWINNLTSLGLLWDGVGVFVLGAPSFLRTAAEIEKESGTYWDYNIHELRSKASLQVDVGVGSLLLLVGFLLQFLASLNIQLSVEWLVYILWLFCPAFLVFYFPYGRNKTIDTVTKKIESAIKQNLDKK